MTNLVGTGEAAAALGLSRSGFRAMVTRARAAGVELAAGHVDARTPLYDVGQLRRWMKNRPRAGGD